MSSFEFDGKCWKHRLSVMDDEGNEKLEWTVVPITIVPMPALVEEYEDLVYELSEKEVELANIKEEYNRKEFEIVYQSDIDFKALYGSAAEKVRKHHAEGVLKELDTKKSDLELSIGFIKNYIPLLREVIRSKRIENL